MSNNLFKSNYVILRGDEKRVIDSNEQMEIKMNHLREIMKQELKDAENKASFSEGIDAQIVETLLEDFDNPESETGMSHLGVLKAEPAYTGPTHEELMEQVRMEADAMLAEASREAEAIKKAAHQEGYQRGLEEGNSQAEKKYQEKVEQLKFDRTKMEESYQNKLEEVEPLFVDALTGIYEHIFHCDLARFREVILFSIQNIIGGGESSKDFIIRVSQEDYAYISDRFFAYIGENYRPAFNTDRKILIERLNTNAKLTSDVYTWESKIPEIRNTLDLYLQKTYQEEAKKRVGSKMSEKELRDAVLQLLDKNPELYSYFLN